MRTFYARYQPIIAFCCALALLLLVYLPTLQTIPNGADHYYMADVGETQVVLNVWGTLHATGYPLYVMFSSALVSSFRLFGVSPAAAPSLTSLVWGIVSLALLYTLLLHLSKRVWLSALLLIPFGLMRTVWIHSVIPEIYSFSLIFLLLLLLVALWQQPIRHRVYWLAFIGGIGVFNHRALVMVAPALLYAVWGELAARPRQLPRVLIVCLLLGLLGFLPYLYLPLRVWNGASWVYGDPGTWQGFLDQFLGREADRYVGLRDSWEALVANFSLVTNVLMTDITLPGIVLGIIGLVYAATVKNYRRAAVTLLLSAAFAYGFHVLFYIDILSALILPILVSLVGGWLFVGDWLLRELPIQFEVLQKTLDTQLTPLLRWRGGSIANLLIVVAVFAFASTVFTENQSFILSLTTDPRGLQTIEQVRSTPPNTTLMIGWGTNHSAAGYAQEVLGLLPSVTLVDHNANIAAVIQNGTLITPEYSFYTFPLDWWETRLGQRVYLDAAAPYLVRVRTAPATAETSGDGVTALEQHLTCDDTHVYLYVTWQAQAQPPRDLSVFVHLLDAGDVVIAQGDQSAPVYGHYPLTLWQAGEVVRDIYPLTRAEGAAQIRFGMYHQETDGSFVNDSEYELAVMCDD